MLGYADDEGDELFLDVGVKSRRFDQQMPDDDIDELADVLGVEWGDDDDV